MLEELVAAGRVASGPLLGPLRRSDRQLVTEAMKRVGRRARRQALRCPSGGQQQRGFIAKPSSASRRFWSSTSRPPGGCRSPAALAASSTRLDTDLNVTVLYVSHESAIERYVHARTRPRVDPLGRQSGRSPGDLARPGACACLSRSSCGLPSPRAPWSASSRRRSGLPRPAPHEPDR